MSRPTVGVHDDPAESFAVVGGVGIALLAATLLVDQGSSYGLATVEFPRPAEVAIATVGLAGLGYAVAVRRTGWSRRAMHGAAIMAVVALLVCLWFWGIYAFGLVTVVALADVLLLGTAWLRGVTVGVPVESDDGT